jgi:hypothetical protein
MLLCDVEKIEKKARVWLVEPRFLDADPVGIFAIACRYRLKEGAKLAAEATLGSPPWK